MSLTLDNTHSRFADLVYVLVWPLEFVEVVEFGRVGGVLLNFLKSLFWSKGSLIDLSSNVIVCGVWSVEFVLFDCVI